MLQPSLSNELTIIVEPSSGIMRVAWARPLLTAGLIDSYYELLGIAVQTGCRFWHFDLRLRIQPAATFTTWFIETFAPLAPQRLGRPVYLAYWLGNRHAALISPLLDVVQREAAKAGLHIAFFGKEPDARAWLLEQRAAEQPI